MLAGRFAIVRFCLAAFYARFTFLLAALTCFVVATAVTSVIRC